MNKRRVCIIGLGGGGGKIIDRISAISAEGPIMAVINTDTRALNDSLTPRKIRIGELRTKGAGTGGSVELGRLSVEDNINKIKPLFKKTDLVILVVALGGGTGTGGARLILEEAKKEGCLTLCFVTMPFSFEGVARAECAKKILPELCETADAVIEISNDLLFASMGNNNMVQAFIKADEAVGTAIRAIWRLITHPGYINLDFADLAHTVRGCEGICSLAYGVGKGGDKAQNAVAELLTGHMTQHGQLITEARSVMISIVGGVDLTLKDISDIMETLHASFSKNIHVVMGTVIDEAWRNKIMVTALLSSSWNPEKATHQDFQKEMSSEELPLTRKKTPRSTKSTRRKEAQSELGLTASAEKRFADANPTFLYGENMDIPTFRRRNITIPE
ncbi:MAG: cell division FtsZ family protein [Kiritimatiellae bacterium]|nr:cell division FtsZ family protein [Kiritimatiellia bacterium]